MRLSKFQLYYVVWTCICLIGYFLGAYYLDIEFSKLQGENHAFFVAYVLNFFLWIFLWGIPTIWILISLAINLWRFFYKRYFNN